MKYAKLISFAMIMCLIVTTMGPISAAVTLPGQEASTHRSHHWGMHLHNGDFRDDSMDLLKDLEVKYVRTDIRWDKLEALVNVYDPEYIIEMDLIFSNLDKNGLEPLIDLTDAPTWAKILYLTNKTRFWTEVSDYHSKVAELWGSEIYYYQLENELNHPARPTYLSKGDIADYMKYARIGLSEHDNDFQTILNSNCEAVGWSVEMDDWLNTGATDHIDIIGLDIYPMTWDTPATLWSALRQTMALTTTKGTAWYDKDIIIAETGFSTYSSIYNEDLQKQFIEVAIQHLNDLIIDFNKGHDNQVLVVSWYELYDSKTGSLDVEHSFGIVEHDSAKKAGYDALKTEIEHYKDLTPFSSGLDLPFIGFGLVFIIIIVAIILIVTIFYGRYQYKKRKKVS